MQSSQKGSDVFWSTCLVSASLSTRPCQTGGHDRLCGIGLHLKHGWAFTCSLVIIASEEIKVHTENYLPLTAVKIQGEF